MLTGVLLHVVVAPSPVDAPGDSQLGRVERRGENVRDAMLLVDDVDDVDVG
jgi:hypothetical protein